MTLDNPRPETPVGVYAQKTLVLNHNKGQPQEDQ